MNEIMNISGIECFEKDGVAYLKLETVARGLGFVDNSKGAEYVRWNTVRQYLGEIGFSQEVAKDSFIPENVFYRLAMKAKNEAAENFQAKIADEVIPSIRKHGAYLTPETIEKAILNPDIMIKLCNELKEEQERRKSLQAKVEEDRPKVEFYNDVTGSGDAIEIGEVAKLLDMGVGRNKLFSILREEKILMRDNIPYQEFVDRGYFEVIETRYQRPNGDVGINLKTLVFQKGVDYIRKVLNERGMRKRKKERKRERNKYESRF